MFSTDERSFIINFVKDIIKNSAEGRYTEKPEDYPARMDEVLGFFIRFMKGEEIVFQIPNPYPHTSLIDAMMNTISGFENLKQLKEIKEDLQMEINIIEEPQLIDIRSLQDYADNIEVGRHGIMLEYGPYSSVILPQDAVKNSWNVEQMLNKICGDAKLPENAWKNPDVNIYRFEAESFSS